MSRRFFLPNTTPPGFWDALVGGNPPDGAIAITDEQYAELNDGAQSGMSIIIDNTGEPVLAPPKPLTSEQVAAAQLALLTQKLGLAQSQKTLLSGRVETLQDAIDLDMATDAEVDELALRSVELLEWKKYAVLLGRLTSDKAWPEVEWPEQPESGLDLPGSNAKPE